ncbi:transcription termination factor 2-like [Argonauta hians]
MESVLCSGHKKECYLKTGTKAGPSFKQSFYICSNRSSQCDFVKPVSIKATTCDKHPSAVVELQRLRNNDNGNWCYYRCKERTRGTEWCGYWQLQSSSSSSSSSAAAAAAAATTQKSIKPQLNDTPSFASESKSKEKAALFKEEDQSKGQVLSETGDGNDSFSQWRDSPAKDSSRQHNIDKVSLTASLEKQKNLLSRVQVSALPDKGARLKENIQLLESQINDLDLTGEDAKSSKPSKEPQVYVVHPPKEAGGKPVHKTVSKPASKEPQVYVVHPPKEAGGKPVHQTVSKPESTVSSSSSSNSLPHHSQNLKQTKIIDAFCLPKEFLEGSYNQEAVPRAALYGGRMTLKRLEDVRIAMDENTAALHRQIKSCPKEDEEEDDPKDLKVTLMPHQKHALAWLRWRQQQIPSGGILADDMGLGKTLTMISFVLKQKQETSSSDINVQDGWTKKENNHVIKSNATLIVTPASVVHQWGKEVESRCKPGAVSVVIYHGPHRERNINRLASKDIVLTTYRIVGMEVGRKDDNKIAGLSLDQIERKEEKEATNSGDLAVLGQIEWKNIILDEAHDIRNYRSITATSVARLKARSRWALTGTPIQNKLLDMYSLFRFLRFHPFDEYKVWKNQVENEGKGKIRLNTIIQTLMLRRTKDQTVNGKPLIKMTKKKLTCQKLTLSPDEQRLYDKIFKKNQSAVRAYINSKDSLLAETSSTTTTTTTSTSSSSFPPRSNPLTTTNGPISAQNAPTGKDILVFLLRLRQCCCHLSLLKESIDEEMKDESGLELSLTDQLQDLTLQPHTKNYLEDVNGDGEGDSGTKEEPKEKDKDIFSIKEQGTKIKAVIGILQDIYKNKEDAVKCVIVSQWTKLLSIVKSHVERAGFICHLLQGNVPPEKRAEIVDDFNNNPRGPEILLLSLRAGGVGLNLIGGRHLFLLDNHWNPALEEQACDRIYRVGQKHDIEIHRFVCENTIEEKIVALQDRKRSLAKDVLTGSNQKASHLNLNDLRMLFAIK